MEKEELVRNTTGEMPEKTVVVAGEVIENVQICPFGEFPNAGREQHCTVKALQAVAADWVANGSKEILVDFEHQSEEGGTSDTSAAAWVSNVRVDPKRGLVGDFKLTDVGAQAVANRRLRFLSVSWFVNKETREPIRITSIALTNKPNIPVAPILNKGVENRGRCTKEENSSTVHLKPTPTPKPTTKERTNMDKIKEALGLAPEATEEDVLAAVTALAQAKKDADAAALDREAEDFAEANAKKCNKEVLKAQYIANKDVAKALVAGIPDAPAAEKPQQLLNKGAAEPGKKPDLVAELNKLPAGEQRIKFVTEHAAEFADAAK